MMGQSKIIKKYIIEILRLNLGKGGKTLSLPRSAHSFPIRRGVEKARIKGFLFNEAVIYFVINNALSTN